MTPTAPPSDTTTVCLLGAGAALLGLVGLAWGAPRGRASIRRPAADAFCRIAAGLALDRRVWSVLLLVLGPGLVVWHAHALGREAAAADYDFTAQPVAAAEVELVPVEGRWAF